MNWESKWKGWSIAIRYRRRDMLSSSLSRPRRPIAWLSGCGRRDTLLLLLLLLPVDLPVHLPVRQPIFRSFDFYVLLWIYGVRLLWIVMDLCIVVENLNLKCWNVNDGIWCWDSTGNSGFVHFLRFFFIFFKFSDGLATKYSVAKFK